MKRLTPERERGIRDQFKNFDFVDSTWASTVVPELLAEIDALRTEINNALADDDKETRRCRDPDCGALMCNCGLAPDE